MLKIKERIKELRESRGITQEEFGRLVGVSKAAVSNWESPNMKNLPNHELIYSLAVEFGVSVDYIYGLCDDPKGKVIITNKAELDDLDVIHNIIKKPNAKYKGETVSSKKLISLEALIESWKE